MSAVFLVACAPPPVQAPDDVGALGRFLFEHFEDTDTIQLGAGWRNLATFLRAQDDADAPEDRALTMPVLDDPALGGLAIPPGASAADQLPVAISGRSQFPLGHHLRPATDPVQTCLEAAITVWAGRSFQSDRACFEAGTCDRLDTRTEVRRELSIFVNVWYDQYKSYRRFEVEDDDGTTFEVLAGRAWTEERFEGDNGGSSVDQLFHLDVFIEDDDTTLRWFSLWSSVSGLLLGDDGYVNLVVNGLVEALQFNEEYLGNLPSSCPHDRTAPRPERGD